MLGVRRETVTLHLGRLSYLGAVFVEKGKFVIDLEVLKRIVDDPDYGRHA